METKAYCFSGLCLVVLTVTWGVLHAESHIVASQFTSIPGLTLWRSAIGTERKTSSMIECVVDCLQNSLCYAVKRFKRSKFCSYHHWILNGSYVNQSMGYNYRPLAAKFLNDGRRHCVLVRPIPVLILKRENNTEKFTLDEANVECEKVGGQLATLQQLRNAWQNGYRACTCGWLNEGTAYAPSGGSHPRPHCMKDFHQCPEGTNRRYHAYCSTEVTSEP